MPTYCTPLLDLAEAERILSLVVKSDPYTPFSRDEVVTGSVSYPGPIPDGVSANGLHIAQWTVTGEFSRNRNDFDLVQKILQNGSDPVLRSDILVSQRFESSRTKQTQSECEIVSVGRRAGKAVFDFSTRMFTAADATVAHQEYFAAIIQEVALPARVVGNAEGFRLEHTQGGEVFNSGTPRPFSFNCELPGATNETLVEAMKMVLARFSSGTEFVCEWTVAEEDFQERPMQPNIVELIRAKHFPADKTCLDLGTILTKVRQLEQLKKLSVSGGVYQIGAGELTSKNEESLAEVQVEIWPGGYVITFENSGSSSRIEKVIGIPLTRANQRKPESEE